MEKFPDDYEVDGQMSIYDLFEDPLERNPLIAVSRIFAKSIKQMNLAEWKTFVMALTQIRWTEQNNNVVRFDKKDLADKVGVHSDSDHLSENLKRAIGKLPAHSFIEIQHERDWVSGCFITQVGCYKNIVRVRFAEEYMPLFQELNKEKNYITMWADDLFKMTSERSILFYEELRLHSDTTQVNSRIFSTKDIKLLFNIPKDGEGSYIIKTTGHLNRVAFEKRIIYPLCDDLAQCRMINLVMQEDGKPFRKVKKHGYVMGYEFSWTISTHPAVATAKEVKELQERVDKDPILLKVAKDIHDGSNKRASKKKKKDMDLSRDYGDLDELSAKLEARTRAENEKRKKQKEKGDL